MSEFLDAQQMKKENPNTFWAPNQKEMDSLQSGQFVKICENRERFWVELTGVDGDILVGRVDNDLAFKHSFKCDDIITFEKKNVMGLISEDEL